MPPPSQRQAFNRDLARRAIFQNTTPDQWAILERTLPPEQLREYRERYAQATDPRAGFDPNDPGGVLTDATPAPAPVAGGAMRSRFLGGAVPGVQAPAPRLPEGVSVAEMAPQDRAAAGIPSGGVVHGEQVRPVTPVVSRGSRYGNAPGGTGDATFGAPGATLVERGRGTLPENRPGLDEESGHPPARPIAEGGGTADVTAPYRNERGDLVFTVAGEHPMVVPAEYARDADSLYAYVRGAVARGTGTGRVDLSDPYAPSLNATLGQAILDTAALADLGAPAATGVGGPRMDATVRQQIRTPGQVSEMTAARLASADNAVEGAHGFLQGAQDAGFVGRTVGAQALSGEQEAEARAMEARNLERTARLEHGLQGLQRRLDDVAGMRVDVNEAFGGFGGRMGAAIAVALGAIGSSLGGGENQALAIVNAMVDRNLQAQRDNISNARADAQARGNAWAQMRDLLGSEEAATQAARALHLTAVATGINGFIEGLGQREQQAGRLLQQRLTEQSLVARQAAAELAATAGRTDVSMRFRGQQSAVQGQLASVLGGGAPSGAGVPAGGTRQPLPGTAGGTGAGPSAARRPAPAVRGRLDPEGMAEAARAFREHDAPATPPIGTRLRTDANAQVDPRSQALFRSVWTGTGGERQHVMRGVALVGTWGRLLPLVINSNRDFRAELTRGEPDVARARAAAWNMRSRLRNMLTGAAFTESEAEEYLAQMPDPNQITTDNVTEWWDGFENAWLGMADSLFQTETASLETAGLEFDEQTSARVAAIRRELDTARQRASQRQAPEPGLMDRAMDSIPARGVVRRFFE